MFAKHFYQIFLLILHNKTLKFAHQTSSSKYEQRMKHRRFASLTHRQVNVSYHIALSFHPIFRLTFSTVAVVRYIGGCSVHRGDNISTVGDSFSTVGDSFSTVGDYICTSRGITSVLWRVFSTVEDTFSTVGITAVHLEG